MILAHGSTKTHCDRGVKGSSRHGQEPKSPYIMLMLEKIMAFWSARLLHSKKIRVRLLKEMKLIFLSWYFLHPGRQLLAKLLLGSNLSESTYFNAFFLLGHSDGPVGSSDNLVGTGSNLSSGKQIFVTKVSSFKCFYGQYCYIWYIS